MLIAISAWMSVVVPVQDVSHRTRMSACFWSRVRVSRTPVSGWIPGSAFAARRSRSAAAIASPVGSRALSQLVPSVLWVTETRRSSRAFAVSTAVSSGSSRARNRRSHVRSSPSVCVAA
ncbi:hypothetical protein BJ975_001405 [Aeromicrobium tamlense]|uniref:Secreted protein n=1 Tax=Aeromicrobium tamlense TaxID=375541 RepID=A0ABX2SKL9_9ACTN|nr:hypothetical protein [Aeromicrobium tamlense]NYI38030.1 hypothetical protein [Aeromicrobium tamlense]